MPDARELLALGLLQGPAELAPVSSSAHVELVPWLLRWRISQLDGEARKEVEVALHAGSALALAARPSGWPQLRLALLSLAPTALAGYVFERQVEARLGTPGSIAAGLLAGSAALLAADRRPGSRRQEDAGARDALWLGIAQSLALVPGVSRSAATLSAARLLGFGRPAAVALARQTALPALTAATALKLVRLASRRPPAALLAPLAGGLLAAAASTTLTLRGERVVARVPFAAWAFYRAALAAAVLVVRQNRAR